MHARLALECSDVLATDLGPDAFNPDIGVGRERATVEENDPLPISKRLIHERGARLIEPLDRVCRSNDGYFGHFILRPVGSLVSLRPLRPLEAFIAIGTSTTLRPLKASISLKTLDPLSALISLRTL